MAKKKAREKKEEIGELSPKELQARLGEAQEARFRLQFRHLSSPLKNPMQIRAKRREIARLMTHLRQKEAKVS
jgi:large subunit ribosomal protein L29